MLRNKNTKSTALEFTAHYLHHLHTYLHIYMCPEIKQIFGKYPICHIENKGSSKAEIDLKMENSGKSVFEEAFQFLNEYFFSLYLLMKYI